LNVSKYLVTGGAGFIGSHITSALVERGDQVRVLDNLSTGDEANLAHLEVGELGSGAPVEMIHGSVTNAADVKAACEGVRGVFHEAAQVSVPQSLENPVESYGINVTGTLMVLDGARRAGVERFVFAASSAAYGDSVDLPKHEKMTPDPVSPYGTGKLAAEELLRVFGRCYGMRTVALRYFNIFGPRQADDSPYTGVIALFARALFTGNAVSIYGDGEQTRDFTHVSNVVQANLLALEAEVEPGSVFNVGTGVQVSVNQLYARMAELLGSDLKPNYQPARQGDILHSLAAVAKATSKLGYAPKVSWQDGLVETVDWYRTRFSKAPA
jgi:nucleoside-diphosphate-sugar epimerase